MQLVPIAQHFVALRKGTLLVCVLVLLNEPRLLTTCDLTHFCAVA